MLYDRQLRSLGNKQGSIYPLTPPTFGWGLFQMALSASYPCWAGRVPLVPYTEERAGWQWGPRGTGFCWLGKEIHTEGMKTVPQHSSTHSCPNVTTKIIPCLKIRARWALEDDLTHTWPLGPNHHFKAGTPRLSKFNRFSWDFQSGLRLDLPNSMLPFSTLYRQCKAVPWEFTGC